MKIKCISIKKHNYTDNKTTFWYFKDTMNKNNGKYSYKSFQKMYCT